VVQFAVWHGDSTEMEALLQAAAHNCGCGRSRSAQDWNTRCSAHRMLAFDQRALDGLLFVRRLTRRLEAEEWAGPLVVNASSS